MRQWMTNESVGLGLMKFEKKDRNASPSCIDVPGAAIRVKLLENQMVASNGAHLHKTPNVNWYNSRPGHFVWSWDPKKAGWHKHPEGTRIFFQKLTSLPLCELGMSFQNQCCPSVWGHSLLRLPSSEAVLVLKKRRGSPERLTNPRRTASSEPTMFLAKQSRSLGSSEISIQVCWSGLPVPLILTETFEI